MGIYIKDMKMPKENELIEVRIYPNGKVSMVHDMKCEQIATATEVPTPHGRLIDADELNRIYEKKRHEHPWQHDCDDWYIGVIDANDELIEAPTIIERSET